MSIFYFQTIYPCTRLQEDPLNLEGDGSTNRVLICIHKEQMLNDVERLYPARHYVMVDDKLLILTTMEETCGDRLTTVWPRQGHYALDSEATAAYPPANLAIEHIGDLLNCGLSSLRSA